MSQYRRALERASTPRRGLAVALTGLALVAGVLGLPAPAQAAPVAPAAPTVTTDGQVLDVSWTAPEGAAVTGYVVRVVGEAGPVTSYRVDASTLSHRFAGLDDGTYRATVTAVEADGASPASAESAAAVVDLDLLASYQFAGQATAAGSVVPDASGNSNAATMRGNGATVSGDVLNLPGGGSNSGAGHVQLPTGLLNGQDTVTVSTWLRNETGSGNYAAMFYGSAANPPQRYWLLNPRNPSGLFKSVVTTGNPSTQPWATETGISPTNAGRGVAGPATSADWGMYTTVIEPTRITAYFNGTRIGSVNHATTLSSFGTNLVGYIGRSSYPDPFYKGGVRDVRIYTKALSDATIKGQYDFQAARDDAAALSVPATAADDLDLPTRGARGSQVSWTSSAPEVIAADGTVTRPTGADATVTLTAAVTQGGRQATRTFTVTVPADDPAADVARISAAYDLATTQVWDDLVLRDRVEQVDVAWTSSAPDVVAEDGSVTRPATRTPVTLTATFTRGAATATRTFDVVVLPADAGRLGTYIVGGNTNRTDAVHLAHADGGSTTFTALNNGRPVRYADSYQTKLGSPTLFRKPGGGFGLLATNDSGSNVAFVYDSTDLIRFRNERRVTFNQAGLRAAAVRVRYDNGVAAYRLTFTALDDGRTYEVRTADFATFTAPVEVAAPAADPAATFPAGAIETSSLGVTAGEQAVVLRKLTRMRSTGVRPLADVSVAEGGTLRLPRAAAVTYSNGGSDTMMGVQWDATDVAAVDTETPGEYVVDGTVVPITYPTKIGHQRADPDVTIGDDGAYYMTASYPQVGSNPEGYDRVVLRRSDTIAGLPAAQEVVLWDEENSALQRYVWAPELTKIGDSWYILFTASRSSNVFDIRPMMLKHTGGDLMTPGNWTEVGPMLAQSGDRAFTGFSLDMTYFEANGRHYVVWAQSVPSSALLLAEIDPANPRQLISPSVTIAYPDLAWEGNTATNQQIDEGAAVIERDGKLLLTFSASTVDDKYSVGLLKADVGANLLDASSWTKTNYPLMTTADLPAGETGPGHNSFTTDEHGNTVIVYHSRTTSETTDGGLTDPSRSARARTVHFDADGDPVLNLTAEEELGQDHRAVSVKVVVEARPVTAPSAPGAPVVTQRTSTGALVSWTAPTDDGGAAVDDYRVVVTQGGQTVSSQDVTGTQVTLSGLQPGTTYAVTVRARNRAGTGPATAPVELTTEVLPAPIVRYPFEDDLEEVVGDRDATAVGAVTFEDGVTLPGGGTSATNHVRLPDDLVPTASPNATVSVWVKSDTPARNGAAVSFGTPPVNGLPTHYWLLNPTGPNGNARSVMTDGINPAAPYNTEKSVSGPNTSTRRGSWVNYTTVFTAGSLTSYVDGVKIGTVAKTRTFADYAAAGVLQGYLGRSNYTADPNFKGSFRELQIFDSALADGQVREIASQSAFILDSAAERLTIGDTSAVTEDLTLPTSLGDGVSVAWATSDAAVVTADGAVTVAGTTRSAQLTATLTRQGETRTRTFVVTVLGRDAQVRTAEDLLVVPPVLASGDPLPSLDADGVRTTWSTTTAGLIIDGSTVTAAARTAGQVTATVSADGVAPLTKTFDVTVLPAAQARFVLGYTRTPLDAQVYGPNLAHSLHLAMGPQRTGTTALNENHGIAFAAAVPTGTVELNDVRTLVEPHLFAARDGGFGVVATRTRSGGTPDDTADDSLLLFTSADLRKFTEVGLVVVDPQARGVRDPRVTWDSARDQYLVSWTGTDGTPRYRTTGNLTDPASWGPVRTGRPTTDADSATTTATGAQPGNALVVDAAAAEKLRVRFGRIANTTVDVDDVSLTAGGQLDLSDLRAELGYDDGSQATRAITWDQSSVDAVDTATPGTYTVTGTVKQTPYAFPFIAGRADPAVIRWNGRYLFMATAANEASFSIRSSGTIAGLASAADSVILTEGAPGRPGPLWAPELHEIGGKLFVFFAAGVDQRCWCNVQAHVMELVGDDPTDAADWGAPKLVQEKEGGRLQLDAAHPGISLDMTYFEDERDGRTVSYVAWSQRYIAGGVTGDAQLWIATVDPADPSRLTSDPVLFGTSEFGWDHNTSAVAEAPYVIRKGDTLYLTYSGSNIDRTYAVGLLTAPAGADLLDPASWTKSGYPVLKSDPTTGQLGPGHSMFAVDEDGNDVLVFHARNAANNSRDTMVRRIHWASDGQMILDMTADEEVAPANRRVTTTVTIEEPAEAADTTDPVVTVGVDPAEADGVAGWYRGAVSVSATAVDPQVAGAVTSGVDSVEYRVGDGAWTSYTAALPVPEGSTTWEFRATDEAGNVSDPVTRTVRRDATAPTSRAATSPARPDGRGGWYTARQLRLTVSGADAGSGVASTQYRLGSGAWRTYTGPVALPAGTTRVQHRSTDAAGNVSAVGGLTVRYDPTAPTVTLRASRGRGVVVVRALARDAVSGLATTRYRVDAGPWRAYTRPVRVTARGRHAVTVSSTDRAGNATTRRVVVQVPRR